jgi:signal transduction histidine kinase
MLSSADHMDHLINDLLRLSRITQQELNFETIDLSKIAHNICKQLEISSPDREIEFIIEENITCQADFNLISVALENLLTNAVKYSKLSTTAVIEFGVNNSASVPIYFVKDNGIGFDQKYSDKIFEPFQRLYIDEDIEGSGIGLSIVKRIIDRHSGEIWVESEIDKGTTFSFTLR